MITEDYCSYDVAELLNEKGFEIDTNKDYWKIGEDGTMYFMSSIGAYTSNPHSDYAFYRPENSYPCPTHQMTMKWLREVHNLFIQITVDFSDGTYPMYDVCVVNLAICNSIIINGYNKYSYKEAVEAALKYCLEDLI